MNVAANGSRRSPPIRRGRLLAAAALCLALPGCFTARYVSQAACGELGILEAARPLGAVIADPGTPSTVRRVLRAVPYVEAFGRASGLRPTPNYRSYAELHRDTAVWVVQACAPLSFDVRRWSFPVVGTVPYLGFFHEDEARTFAAVLARDEGLDVDVRTASAYSTLGWFRDPILSTMIPDGPQALGELANTVLHESVHATLYIDDQSAFDESLASFVADDLTPRFLARAVGPDAPEARAWSVLQARYERFVRRLHATWVELDALYRSGAPDAEKLAGKARILATVEHELGLGAPLNNAALAGYRTYDTGGPAFARLLAACGGSWPRALKALGTLESSSFATPQQEDFGPVVDALTRRGCPG